MLAVALIFPQHGTLRGTDSLSASVELDKLALVRAGARAATPGGDLAPSPATLHVALYVAAENGAVTRPQNRDGITSDPSTIETPGNVRWDADVIVLGGLTARPTSSSTAAGTVVAANAVQLKSRRPGRSRRPIGLPVPLDADGSIHVADIANSGYGDVVMEADDAIANEEYLHERRQPAWPMFEFRDTLAERHDPQLLAARPEALEDRRGQRPLRRRPAGAARSPTRGGEQLRAVRELQFDLRYAAPASYVDIEQRAATARSRSS